ncbi:hypothetical protein H0H92_000602 [Tricholoma furcatifolium]|nr:hypothetical protein H0H92_000602 [Tricholoma furcatifolium]
MLKEFEKACKQFFCNKHIPNAEQINHVLSVFEGDNTVTWVSHHEAEFSAEGFMFARFLTALHAKWISDDIMYRYRDILNTPQGTRTFDNYEAIICSANCALAAFSNIHLSNAHLREHFKLHFNANFCTQYKHVNGVDKAIDNIVSYDNWCLCVSCINKSVCACLNTEHAAFCRCLAELNKENEKKHTSSSSAANTSSSNANNNSTTNCKYAMKLTDNEQILLNANNGCCSCHTLWKGLNHSCKYATKPLPSSIILTITQQYIDKKCDERSKALKRSKVLNTAKTTTVAAVFGTSSNDSDNSDGSGPEIFADAKDEPEDTHPNEYVLLEFPCASNDDQMRDLLFSSSLPLKLT